MLINLRAQRIAHLVESKLFRLFAGIQTVVGHTGFAKRLYHLRKPFFSFIRFRRHAEIRQAIPIVIKGIRRLLGK